MGIEVKFFNRTMGEYSSILWDFGDGATSTEENPVHVYDEEGEYTVSIDIDGSVISEVIDVSCPVAVLITPDFSYYTECWDGYTVVFTDESTGNVSSWLWDFGDGQTSTEQNPVHTYDETQRGYFVTLTVNGTETYSEDVMVDCSGGSSGGGYWE